MTIGYVQSNQTNASSTVSSTTCAFLSSNTLGNGFICADRVVQPFTTTYSDNNANSYTNNETSTDSTGGDSGAVGSALVASVTNNPATVTITPSSNSTIRTAIHEFSGLASSAGHLVTDGVNTANGATTTPDSGTITTTNAIDLIFGAFPMAGTGATVTKGDMGTGSTSNVTLTQAVGTDKLACEFAIVSTTSSGYHANCSLSGAGNWSAIVVAYQGSSLVYTPFNQTQFFTNDVVLQQ